MKLAQSLARVLAFGITLVACGGEEPPPERAPDPVYTVGGESKGRSSMQVQGTLGTIPERKILAVLEPKLPAFQRCFFNGSAEVELIAGAIKLYFIVDEAGRVTSVYPLSSSIGHRATEQCILAEAKRSRFPEPKGGTGAELQWGFEMDGVGGRPPIEWDSARVSSAIDEHREALSACGAGHFAITAYIEPGGRVIGVGVAVSNAEDAERIDCVVDEVKSWQMPDPGSYTAKVSFELD